MIVFILIIVLFILGCYLLSFYYFIKFIYHYRKSDKQYTKFLMWFEKEYKDIL